MQEHVYIAGSSPDTVNEALRAASRKRNDCDWHFIVSTLQSENSPGGICGVTQDTLDMLLQKAVQCNKVEYAGFFVARGASIDAVDESDEPMLLLCTRWPCNCIEAAAYLLCCGASMSRAMGHKALTRAARHGYVELIRLLFLYGVTVNEVDAARCTALHVAAKCGHVQVVNLLLEYGADPFALNLRRESPRDVAVYCGHTIIVNMLPVLDTGYGI